jgi:hypothetical protein
MILGFWRTCKTCRNVPPTWYNMACSLRGIYTKYYCYATRQHLKQKLSYNTCSKWLQFAPHGKNCVSRGETWKIFCVNGPLVRCRIFLGRRVAAPSNFRKQFCQHSMGKVKFGYIETFNTNVPQWVVKNNWTNLEKNIQTDRIYKKIGFKYYKFIRQSTSFWLHKINSWRFGCCHPFAVLHLQ